MPSAHITTRLRGFRGLSHVLQGIFALLLSVALPSGAAATHLSNNAPDYKCVIFWISDTNNALSEQSWDLNGVVLSAKAWLIRPAVVPDGNVDDKV